MGDKPSKEKQVHLEKEEDVHDYMDEDVFFGDKLAEISKEQMKDQKYRNIGALELNHFKYGKGHGSGVLISRDLVLTAAHNVFNRGSREINGIKFWRRKLST